MLSDHGAYMEDPQGKLVGRQIQAIFLATDARREPNEQVDLVPKTTVMRLMIGVDDVTRVLEFKVERP